ncbi:MAG: leucine-rich repeat protein [Bacteroidales bacterium]
MKHLYLLFLSLFIVISLKAQVERTLEVTAGNLGSLIANEPSPITSLTLTGTINAEDIRVIGYIKSLTYLDISQTNITATYMEYANFPDNWWPGMTISRNSINDRGITLPNLKTIKLPNTIQVLGCGAFYGCGFTSITFPASLETIGFEAFCSCVSLQSLSIPGHVNVSEYAFASCTGLKELVFEEGFDFISRGVFAGCSSLTTITFPSTLEVIQYNAFGSCPNIKSIYCKNPLPPALESASFVMLDKSKCTVYVPAGSAFLYKTNEDWKDFTNIVETLPGFNITSTLVSLGSQQGSTATSTVTTNMEWEAFSDNSWLTVSPSSGNSTQQVTITADANPSPYGRYGTVVFVYGDQTKLIMLQVIQEGLPKTINLTAGTLNSVLTEEELNVTTSLILTGTIDVRDFQTMRDKMPMLTNVDLKDATITSWTDEKYYPANTIPARAFYKKSSLTSILLPETVSVINGEAFSYCTGLTNFKIPSTVTFIDMGAFMDCTSLETLSVYAITPPEVNNVSRVFQNINREDCTLLVPKGSRENYSNDFQWEIFKVIEPLPSINLSAGTVAIKEGQTAASVRVTSEDEWLATSDQQWLTVSPSSGMGTQTLTFTAQSNPSEFGRMAKVTVKAAEFTTQQITVIQEGLAKTVNLTAGNLSKVLTADELNGITHLILTGEMNLFDFRTLNNQMPLLTYLDLSGVTIAPYADPMTGTYGSANSIPENAFFNASTYMGKNSLTSILLPVHSLMAIRNRAFAHCNGLTAISIPSTINSMEANIFDYCQYLDTIGIHAYPVVFNPAGVPFHDIKSTAKVYIPYGYMIFYQQAQGWKDLKNIVEMPGYRLSASTLSVKSPKGSTATATISSNVNWTAGTDQPWLSINPSTGSGNQELTFTSQVNASDFGRIAQVTFTVPNAEPQTITVIQEGKPKTVNLTAGKLSTLLTMNGITSLTITGEMDARDFKTIRDRMPLLTSIDLTEVHIKAYTGTEGTLFPYYDYNTTYNEDEIPYYALLGKSNLISLLLPHSSKRIEGDALSQCMGLKTFKIPGQVNYIDYEAFKNCVNLDTLYSFPFFPPKLSQGIFFNVDKDKAVLMVPFGASDFYRQQAQWQDFKNIMEISGINVLSRTVTVAAAQGSTATAAIESNVSWTATSTSSWLKVSPSSATGNQQLSFTADANPSNLGRAVTVIISAPGIESKTITVIQEGKPQTVYLTAGDLYSVFSEEELNGITSLTITGEMDARDFMIMRDKMPLLSTIDLSGAKIVWYSTASGTSGTSYFEDRVPQDAFYTSSTQTGKSSLTSILLPESLRAIDYNAFSNCMELTSIKIPSKVEYIQSDAFSNCINVKSIYSYAAVPPNLGNGQENVFGNVRKETCILYVPKGTKELYAKAHGWKDFTHIVELGDFELSATELSIEAEPTVETVMVNTDKEWTAASNQDWLTISPSLGEGPKEITLTAQNNEETTERVAIVTLLAPEATSKTITVIQHGLVTGVDKMASPMAITCYPNPFTSEMSIEIANPSLREVNVEIYSVSGQKIKTLLKGQKGAKISLVWNGEDEDGRKVVPGIYLLKVNEETRKVVKR